MSAVTKPPPSDRLFAVLSYVLFIVGGLLVLLTQRRDSLAAHHARQSLGIAIAFAAVLGVWIVFGWLITLIPYVGSLMAVATFALVMLTFFYLLILWIVGLVAALRGNALQLPLVDTVVQRVFFAGKRLDPDLTSTETD